MNTMGVIAVILVWWCLDCWLFLVPVPHSENHGMKIGDTKIGVQTQHSEKLPPAVGVVLLVGGVVALAVGARKP
jgi:hypothetical protein